MSSLKESPLIDVNARLYPIRHLVFIGCVVCSAILLIIDDSQTAPFWALSLLCVALLTRGTTYYDPSWAFAIPLGIILSISQIPVSSYARPMDPDTVRIIVGAIACFLLPFGFDPGMWSNRRAIPVEYSLTNRLAIFFLSIYMALALANVMASGYVPLIEGVRTGNTRYMEFGIKSLYGLTLAYGAALATCLAYSLLIRPAALLKISLLLVLLTFVLFVTRLYIVMLLVQFLVIRSLIKGPFANWKVLAALIAMSIGFALVGEFRAGDIRALVGVNEAFEWLPDTVIWIYAYSFFNVLNLDNLVSLAAGPKFDGSMFDFLLPSILRAPTEWPDLENPSFTVSTFLYILINDVGLLGALGMTLLFGLSTRIIFQMVGSKRTLSRVGAGAVMYFCALTAFFNNQWLLSSVIAQIPLVFAMALLNQVSRATRKSS